MNVVQTIPLPETARRILQLVFDRGEVTRQLLAEELGCTLMTVSKSVTALLDEGLLRVDRTLPSSVGRRTSILCLVPDYRLTIAMDIGYGGVKLGLVGLDGTLLRKVLIPRYRNPIQEGVPFESAMEVIDSFLTEFGRERFLGIAVGISGMVDYEAGRVLFSPNIHGFDDRPLAQELSARFSLPVLLDTSARCMAVGEFRFGAGRGVPDQIFLSLGTGSIASGIHTGGKLYRGADGFAGEIGHTCVRPGKHLLHCSCGRYDCLELYATMEMIRAHIQEALFDRSGSWAVSALLSDPPLTPERLREVVDTHDPIVTECFERAVEDIASVLTGAVNLMTPSLVILGGGLAVHFPYVVEELDRRVRSSCLMPLRQRLTITGTRLGEDAALRGGGIMLTEQYFGED